MCFKQKLGNIFLALLPNLVQPSVFVSLLSIFLSGSAAFSPNQSYALPSFYCRCCFSCCWHCCKLTYCTLYKTLQCPQTAIWQHCLSLLAVLKQNQMFLCHCFEFLCLTFLPFLPNHAAALLCCCCCCSTSCVSAEHIYDINIKLFFFSYNARALLFHAYIFNLFASIIIFILLSQTTTTVFLLL